jgi:NADH:ubiquinone oxidoreductase subunit K
MRIQKIAAIYSIMLGIAMIGMWLSLITTNQVPEINTEPIRITYHLIGEFLTAILLLIGGFGLFTKRRWGFHVFLISMGMLLYTVIVSAGYYAEKGDMAMVGMFTVFQVLTVIFIGLSFYKWKEFKAK